MSLEKPAGESKILPQKKQESAQIGQDIHDYELMVNCVHDYGIILLDPKGFVVTWNPGAERFKGYTAEEIIGQHFSRFYPSEAVERGFPDEELHIAAAEGRFEDEGWRLRKDGSLFWANVIITALRDETGELRGFAKLTRDLTERKQAEAFLKTGQQRLTLATQSAHIGIWDWDIVKDKLVWDDQMYVLYGIREQDFGGAYEAWRAGLHPEDREKGDADITAALNGTQDFDTQFRVVWPDGEVRFIEAHAMVLRDENNVPLRMIGANWDITDRKQIEESLRASEARFYSAFEYAPIGVALVSLEGQWLQVNQSVCDVVGYSETELMKLTFQDITHPDDLEGDLENVQKLLRGEIRSYQMEKRYFHALGHIVTVLLSVSLVRDSQGEPLYFISQIQDITERKRVEAELRRAHNELEERVTERTAELMQANEALKSAKIAADAASHAKSEFLSRMSHELRTPLNAILGFGQLLEMRNPDPIDQENVNHILKSGNHLLALINEVLDIARVESGRMELSIEPILMGEVLRESVILVKSLATKNGINLEAAQAIISKFYALADHQRLKQVFINLLSNAIKYNKPDGKVAVSCTSLNGRVRVAITDTGPGISPQNLSKLFTPFERLDATKTTIEGTGLGLAFSKSLVEAMGGVLGVESVVGKGSTFYVELPQTESQSSQASEQVKSLKDDKKMPDKVFKVLLIEDNVSNYQLIESILAYRPGVQLLGAMQGSIGLDMARHNQPDVILLDLHLPDIMGDEVLRQLRDSEATAHIPIIVVSADATANQIQRLLKAGANFYLTKPLNVREFLTLLDETLENAGAA